LKLLFNMLPFRFVYLFLLFVHIVFVVYVKFLNLIVFFFFFFLLVEFDSIRLFGLRNSYLE